MNNKVSKLVVPSDITAFRNARLTQDELADTSIACKVDSTSPVCRADRIEAERMQMLEVKARHGNGQRRRLRKTISLIAQKLLPYKLLQRCLQSIAPGPTLPQ